MGARSVRVAFVFAAVVPLVWSGCSSSSNESPTPDVIAANGASSGNGQTAQVGTVLPESLKVVVTLSGAVQAGKTITWAARNGASISPSSSVTNAGGVASASLTLGASAGIDTATATLAGATGSPVVFTATASAVPLPVIAKPTSATGDSQTAGVTAALPNPLRVLVTLTGAPQAGDTVVWGTTGAGSSVNPIKAVTDASGIATTTWTLGQVSGSQTATATLTGATGSPVTFTATASPGAATQLQISSGNNQTALVNAAFAQSLAALVADQFGNGVAGDTVAWAVATGSATIAPPKSVSDANGIARASLTAGGSVGAVTVTATHAGLTGSPLTFTGNVSSAPLTASVNVGNFFFKSVRNASQNPAVDTIAVNGTVTWNFTGGTHGVQSTGSPSFTGQSAAVTTGTFQFTFTSAGSYSYDCLVHGTLMTGTIVVQ